MGRIFASLLILSACSADEGKPGASNGAGTGGALTGGSGSVSGGSGGSTTAGTGGAATGGAGAGGTGTTGGASGTSGTGGSVLSGGVGGAGAGGISASGGSGVAGAPATGGVGAEGGLGAGGSGGGVGGSAGDGMSGQGGGGGATAGTSGSSGTGGTSGTGGSGGSGGGSSGGKGVVGTPIGFATLNGGTTGGGNAQPVTVTSYAELKSAAESGNTAVILVSGTIENGPNGGVIAVKSNKSIVGVGNNALLNGVGLDINNSNNVIIQNLRITLMGVTTRTDTPNVYSSTGDEGMPQILVNGGDAIGIRGSSKNIWIDHCDIYAEDPSSQTNKDLYDGLIDVKNETGFITISWNYFHDQHKGGLVGASDSDVFADRKITFHHNHYDKVKLRVPMYRGSTGHFFNNYVVGAQDATEIRADTCVRVEKNYYEALHYSIYTTSDSEGSTQRIDNVEVMRTERAYPPNCTADIPYSYSSVLINTTNDVKTLVPAGAGVGKI